MIHHRKMQAIHEQNKVQATAAREVGKMLKKSRESRKQTKDFLTNERNITINKDNQILLNKLVEISSGKWSSVAPPVKKVRNQSVKAPAWR